MRARRARWLGLLLFFSLTTFFPSSFSNCRETWRKEGALQDFWRFSYFLAFCLSSFWVPNHWAVLDFLGETGDDTHTFWDGIKRM
ncbi:hypothetical protein CCUS01_12035 [Colletotrichum cuscutae]|uniref:Secreted protein n=1 Tax=Colletotrichum cuscutae TaxID=1209917 RepID=A0AAI9TXZ7_9PEZI|nr:hypothetical protein CCUS01_12035 [Colletotrichum cuscutae]